VAAVSRPQVIDDEEHERAHDRVAAVDVAKDSGMVCTRTPHPSRPGARRSTVWTVRARMAAVRALGHQLRKDGIEVVTLESTSDYWRIWFFVLEACGLAVQLVNASQARNLPGRPKTDPLTELPGGVSRVSGRVGALVATVADHDHRRRYAAGPVAAGDAAGRVA
jgi:transposase